MMSELNMSFVQQRNSATHSPHSQTSNDITYRIKSPMVQFVTSHFHPNLISKCSPCPNVFIASEKTHFHQQYLEQICLCAEIFSRRVVQLDDACLMQLFQWCKWMIAPKILVHIWHKWMMKGQENGQTSQ